MSNSPSIFILRLAICCFIFALGPLHSQQMLIAQEITLPDTVVTQPSAEELLQVQLEALAEESESEIDFSEVVEDLEVFLKNPLNLNTASADDLRRLMVLNEIQIQNLLQHISKFGRLISLLELQSVEGFDLETIRRIQPFITVQQESFRRHFSWSNVARDGQSQLFLRFQQLLEPQKGFSAITPEELEANPNARYLGSAFRLFTRYRFTYYNNISIGFTAEKDPGEQFFAGSQPNGFDYYSGHIFLRDFGRVKAVALGDFLVQFGQGLTMWAGLSFGKSAEGITAKKNGLGLRPYTSVDENNFLRGAGVTVAVGPFEITGFYSSKYRDANVLELDTISGEVLVFTSLQQTGLHRTPSELKDRKAVNETFYGGNVEWNRRNFTLGVSALRMELGSEFRRSLSFYNQFDFNERENTNVGMYYSLIVRNFNFFGEAARSENGGFGILNGIMMGLDHRLSLSLVHRKFSKEFQPSLASAFAESTRPVNEEGLYIGLNARLSQRWRVTAYADHFHFPWMRFRTYLPSRGYEYLVQVSFRPTRGSEIYARYRIKNRPLNSQAGEIIRPLEDVVRQNYRLHASYPVSPSVTLRNRVEIVEFQQGNVKEYGYMVYQDVVYRAFMSPLALTARFAVFDTDGFNSRIYAFENDVLYAFSFPFYSDRGTRTYLLAQYSLGRNIDLYARLAQTWWSNRNESGSGLDVINRNTRTEIKAQLRVRF